MEYRGPFQEILLLGYQFCISRCLIVIIKCMQQQHVHRIHSLLLTRNDVDSNYLLDFFRKLFDFSQEPDW